MSDGPHVKHASEPAGASFRMMRALGLAAIFSGFLIVFVFRSTEPRILENKRRALERAVFQVLPGVRHQMTFSFGPQGVTPAAESEASSSSRVYAGFDEGGRLIGIALEAAGQGYQDTVRILYGYSPERECLIGMTVLDSRETPGLGDKIEKDSQFLSNFECLDVRLNEEKTALLHPVEFVKSGQKSQAWQIDGITGATISSKAVAGMLDESTRAMLPRLVASLPSILEQGREFLQARKDATDTGGEP